MVAKRWRADEVAVEGLEDLARAVGCSRLTAMLLRQRGVADEEGARRFLEPKLTHLHDPMLLPDMDRATERLARAIRERERVAIFGDYDVDGVTSTCLLQEFLALLGMRVDVRLPDRLLEGYGIRPDAVRDLARAGCRLIVAVDNGTSAHDAISTAADLGVDVVVVDHHEAPADLPPAVAVVNPHRPDSTYPFKDLAGVGVTFKVVWALAQRLSRQTKVSEEFRTFLIESLALVALGTICDVVPLLGENRILTRFGLRALERTRRPGLRHLVGSILREKRDGAGLDASDVAFRIGPRLNAAGRLGKADAALRLIVTDDESEARELCEGLEKENRRRQKIEQDIFQEARETVERDVDLTRTRAIVLAGDGWHPGIVGIVASRIVEQFHRPTLLISIDGDRGRGSARSIPGVHICEALASCRHCLAGFGGHEMAAGVEIERARIDDLRAALDAAISMPPHAMVPEVRFDAPIHLPALDRGLLDELELLAPFGRGNPEPLFSVDTAEIVGTPRLLGAEGRHVAFHVREDGAVFRAVGFGKGELYSALSIRGAKVSFLLEPQVSRWQGRSEIELIVRDLRVL